MKISLELIAQNLKKRGFSVTEGQYEDKFCLEQSAFYTKDTSAESNTIYICPEEDWPEQDRVPADSAVICIVKSLSAPEEKSANTSHSLHSSPAYLFVETADIFRLSNEIQAIFRFYNQWETSMESIVRKTSGKDGFRGLLNVSDPVFENGLSLMDSSFRILAMTETNRIYGGYETVTDQYIPEDIAPDIMSMLITDDNYQSMSECREVTLMEDTVLPYRTLNKNIYVDDAFVYRLAVTECIRPFCKSDEMLLEILADYVLQYVNRTSESTGKITTPLAWILEDMIQKDIINKAALDVELGNLGWREGDLYCILCLRHYQAPAMDNTRLYYCLETMREFPGSFAFLSGNDIAVLINARAAGRSMSDVLQEISVFIREHNFRAGTSNYFHDLYRIRKYYRQAEISLDIGSKENPSAWRHSFGNYVLKYIRSMATREFEQEELCSPVYYRLKGYDEENGTELLRTLECYLKHQMNAVRTAEELFIHRSTMLYRLKRICEIGKTSLEDQEELLHLYLTFYLLVRP